MKKLLPLFLFSTLSAGHLHEIPALPGYPDVEHCFVSKKDRPKKSYEEHFAVADKAFAEQNWALAAENYRVVKYNYFFNERIHQSLFNLAVAYYHLGELESANYEFDLYLRGNPNPVHFRQIVEYKFGIAEQFKEGAKRRMFNSRNMPRLLSGANFALELYDEVIAAVPSHDIAAKALYSKAALLWKMREFHESVETFQLLTKRFPKHELAPDCYVAITKVFLEQIEYERQNPDLIVFGEINLRRFSQEFPREERVAEVEGDVQQLKEIYANGLYETGLFYERTKKPSASLIYYKSAIDRFPGTAVAGKCEERIAILNRLPELSQKS